jgi:hypothetical protein
MIRSLRLAALALLATGIFAAQARAACKLEKIATLPVTMTDLRPLVAAKINGADAVFLADSGATYSLMPAARAAEFGLRSDLVPLGSKLTGVGGDVTIQLTRVAHFTVAGQTLTNEEFLVGGSELGRNTAGLIGRNILAYADTEYDLADGLINLIRPQGCGGHELA